MPGSDADSIGAVEAALDELQRESEHRRRELREIAAALPAAVSRRAILRAAIADVRRLPDKGEVLARGAGKLARAPRRAYRAARDRLADDASTT